MANRVVGETDKQAVELKKEFQRLMNSIIDGDDYAIHDTNQAIGVLSSMMKLKTVKYIPYGVNGRDVPQEFKCPLSGEIMSDPVVLASGQTYNRSSIQRWLQEGKRVCPRTEKNLSHTTLVPNILVREMVEEWCKERNIRLPQPSLESDQIATELEKGYVTSLLEKMSSSLSDQIQAAAELQMLTKMRSSLRRIFGELDNAIHQLISPLITSEIADSPADLQENVITTMLNLAICLDNKRVIGEHPSAIHLLVNSLKAGTIKTRRNAAATLFTLSDLESNKNLIGNSGALKALIGLLGEGNALDLKKDVAQAVYNLCTAKENVRIAVSEGAVEVILKMIREGELVEEASIILALLSCHAVAVDEMGQVNAVSCLLSSMKESNCSAVFRYNCLSILHNICLEDRTLLEVIRDDETKDATLSKMLKEDIVASKAKRKAKAILNMLDQLEASSSQQPAISTDMSNPC